VARIEAQPSFDQSSRHDLHRQFLRLVAPAYKPTVDLVLHSNASSETLDQRWQAIQAQEVVQRVRWDSELGRYVVAPEKG
jgi:hypothetical protein